MGVNMNEDFGIRFLYENPFGRVALQLLSSPVFSKAVGVFMDTGLSTLLIPGFIKNNDIDMNQYISMQYNTFNEFFTRPIKRERRPVDLEKNTMIAPCDAMLTTYKITADKTLLVKGQEYSVAKLLHDRELAAAFADGLALVFRLRTVDYHRYIYFDNCSKTRNNFIPGRLHTVRPGALLRSKVFTENAREYTVMHTQNFGFAVQIEVGAMMVGRIKNHHGAGVYKKGEEKGQFEFGGSTIVVLLQKDRLRLREDILQEVDANKEIYVTQGEKIGESLK